MRYSSHWRIVAVAVMLAAGAGSAFAQAPSGSPPVEVSPASPATLAAFKADPNAFVAGIIAAKGDLGAVLSGIIVKDPSVLTSTEPGKPSLVAAASKSVPDQEKAFVRGVADAARSFVLSKQQDVFTSIQTAVVTQFDPVFQGDFASAISDIRTTALGGSGGAGGGPTGGLQNGGPNNAPFSFASETAKNTGPVSPQVGVSSASSSSGTTGTNTTTTTLITRTVNLSNSPTALSGP